MPSSPAAETHAAVRVGLILAALAPFGFGYFLSYLFRAVNAVVAPDLVRDLGLSASALGLLTAVYLLAFALFQLPLGILLDRYGPRRVQAGLLALAAVGALAFAFGQSTWQLAAARGLIGLGFAGGLMAGFKAVVLWVAEPRRPLANACVMSFGALGLIVSTAPMAWAVGIAGWRPVFVGLAGLTLAIAALIFVNVPERAARAPAAGLRPSIAALGRIYSDRAFLGLAPLLGASAGTHLAIQTLWAGAWFRDVVGLDRAAVAQQLLAMAIAFFVGILATGFVADALMRRGVGVLTIMLWFVLTFLASQALILLDVAGFAAPAWIAFGMLGQVAILAFPWLSSHFGAAVSGRANTAMNLVIFMAAFAIQAAIGWVLDLYPQDASGAYPATAYRTAFGACLAVEVAALAWFLANWRRYGARAATQ